MHGSRGPSECLILVPVKKPAGSRLRTKGMGHVFHQLKLVAKGESAKAD